MDRYSPGFQLSVAAVFGILLPRKPLQVLLKRTVLRPLQKLPELLSNLLAVSLAAQIATAHVSNGFLSTLLVWVAESASALPISARDDRGAMLSLVGLFYLGCLPAAVAEPTFSEERWLKVACLFVLWSRSGFCSSQCFKTMNRGTCDFAARKNLDHRACNWIRDLWRG